MSQNMPWVRFAGNIPADLKCGFCQQPVQGEFYRTMDRFACTACAAKVESVLDCKTPPQALLRGTVAGLLAGLGSAVAWATVVHATNHEIGYVASFIGYAVGKAVHLASGKRRGPALQWLAAGLSVIGILGGKLMQIAWAVVDLCNQKGIAVTPERLARVMKFVFIDNPNGFDLLYLLLWTGIAIYAAFRICKELPITIGGPYPLTLPQDTGLQFETVEPATRAAPEQP